MNSKAFDEDDFHRLKSYFFGQEVPWIYSDTVAHNDDEGDTSGGYFIHNIFVENRPVCTSFDNILNMFRNSVDDVKALIRMRFILYPRTTEVIEHKPHVDFEFEHKGALIYMNTNNGFTRSGSIVSPSIENTVYKHDPSHAHNSSTCSDHPFRGVLTVNYF